MVIRILYKALAGERVAWGGRVVIVIYFRRYTSGVFRNNRRMFGLKD